MAQKKNKLQNPALRKTAVSGWLAYPKHKPNLGDEILVCYGDNNKKEFIQWTIKMVGTGIKFKWFRPPDCH